MIMATKPSSINQLTVDVLSAKIAALAVGEISVPNFEVWFRVASRNFHLWAEAPLQEAVLSVERVLSEYHFG